MAGRHFLLRLTNVIGIITATNTLRMANDGGTSFQSFESDASPTQHSNSFDHTIIKSKTLCLSVSGSIARVEAMQPLGLVDVIEAQARCVCVHIKREREGQHLQML